MREIRCSRKGRALGTWGALLALALVSSECSIYDGPTPSLVSSISDSVSFHGDLIADGEGEVVAMLNDAAVSEKASRPLAVRLRVSIPNEAVDSAKPETVRLGTEKGYGLRLKPLPEVGSRSGEYVLEWRPERCSRACVRTAPLRLEDPAGLPPWTMWTLSAEIVYRPWEDSVPDGAGLVVGLRPDAGSPLATSIGGHDKPGVLLTPEQPRAHLRFQLRVPRNELGEEVPPGATSQLTWAGGAVRGLAARPESAARVTLTTGGGNPITARLDGSSRLYRGIAGAAFEVPFRVRCSEHICTADMEASYDLVEGPWILVNLSNNFQGIVTPEGSRVPGARLRAVE